MIQKIFIKVICIINFNFSLIFILKNDNLKKYFIKVKHHIQLKKEINKDILKEFSKINIF